VEAQSDIKMKDNLEPNEEKHESQIKLKYIPAENVLPLAPDLEPILIDSLDSGKYVHSFSFFFFSKNGQLRSVWSHYFH